MVKSICSSYKGPGFDIQHPHDGPKPSEMPVPWDSDTLGLFRLLCLGTCVWYSAEDTVWRLVKALESGTFLEEVVIRVG